MPKYVVFNANNEQENATVLDPSLWCCTDGVLTMLVKANLAVYSAAMGALAEGCEEVGISPNDWTAPVAVGTTIEVRVTASNT